MDERTYDQINNEGGEGYNPYRAERERREHTEMVAEAKVYAATTQGKVDALYRRIKLECGWVAREWGNNGEIDAKALEIRKKIAHLKAEQDAEFLGVWTLDITKARRIAWNDFVKAKLIPLNGAPNGYKLMHKREQAQGWTLDDLKRAVKSHNL